MDNYSQLINQYQEFLSKSTVINLIGPLFDQSSIECNQVSRPIIFVDGGINFIHLFENLENKASDFFSIGDGDSANRPLKVTLPQKKDFSDLKFSLEYLPSNIQEVYLYGLQGGREDHLLANFGEIHHTVASKEHIRQINMDDKTICLPKGSHQIQINGTFSILSIVQNQVQLTGDCEYHLQKKTPLTALSSKTISNKGHGTVNIQNSEPLFIFTQLEGLS